jgi:hypothetical protein
MNEGLGFDVDQYIESLAIKEPKQRAHALKYMGVKTRRSLSKELQQLERKNRELYSSLYYFKVRGDI